MVKNTTMATTPNAIITKLAEKQGVIKRDNGLASEALLFAKKGGKAGKADKGGKCPKRDKIDTKGDNNSKEKHLQHRFHHQPQEHITETCLRKHLGDTPRPAETVATASTETTLNHTTSIKNYWMVDTSCASSVDWLINCKCTSQISSRQSTFTSYTQYPPNTKTVKEYNRVTSFASGYWSVWVNCPLRDGSTDTIVLQEVVHLSGSFNLISQSQIMEKNVIVKPVNHCGLNLYNSHGKFVATAPQVDGLFGLDRVLSCTLESTEYTDIDNYSCKRHLRRWRMHLDMRQTTRCNGTPACHSLTWRLWQTCQRSLLSLRIRPGSVIARVASCAS